VLGAFACARASDEARHGAGARPARIVTIGGPVTEAVFALGAGGRVIAVDVTSTYPAAVAALPKVGYQRALSAEGLLALDPELVVRAALGGRARSRRRDGRSAAQARRGARPPCHVVERGVSGRALAGGARRGARAADRPRRAMGPPAPGVGRRRDRARRAGPRRPGAVAVPPRRRRADRAGRGVPGDRRARPRGPALSRYTSMAPDGRRGAGTGDRRRVRDGDQPHGGAPGDAVAPEGSTRDRRPRAVAVRRAHRRRRARSRARHGATDRTVAGATGARPSGGPPDPGGARRGPGTGAHHRRGARLGAGLRARAGGPAARRRPPRRTARDPARRRGRTRVRRGRGPRR
jgi:hypothetical protein